ncbi:MAG: exodeoxyribonuclease VII large subunit [Alphaproteobacteria bacterium]
MDIFDFDGPKTDQGSNAPELSVSEIAQAVKRTVETAFDRVRIRGEISRPNYHRSGHLYLTLKDEKAVIDAVCWRGAVSKLSIRAEEGMEVIVTGKLTTFPGGSKYQVVIEQMELAGEGALLKLLEDRRKRLTAEGLFEQDRKRPLPYLPRVIGVVTSPTGAVIRDILHRVSDRFPRHVILWPVAVQGEKSAPDVAKAIRGFNALDPNGSVPRPDVLIVGRGGGSLEDLWGFNEEVVVRAVAESEIPVISAVGHETDTTLIDFVADRRAPTPTGAAEMAVPVRADLIVGVEEFGARISRGLQRRIAHAKTDLSGMARGLGDPNRLLHERRQSLDVLDQRLDRALQTAVRNQRNKLETLSAKVRHPREKVQRMADLAESLSQRLLASSQARVAGLDRTFQAQRFGQRLLNGATRSLDQNKQVLSNAQRLLDSFANSRDRLLEQGYVWISDAEGSVVPRAANVTEGMGLKVHFLDGAVDVVAGSETPPAKAPKAAPRPKKPSKEEEDSQGSLL